MARVEATPCENCGRLYNHKVLKDCPGCHVTSGSGIDRYIDPKTLTPDYETQLLLREVLKGVNRTTYAVRAIVSLIAIAFITTGLVYLLLLLAGVLSAVEMETMSAFTNFIAWVVAIVGTIVAYRQFYKEWLLSDVPSKS